LGANPEKWKLMGQINLVLIGKEYLREGGSFTLTSGIASEMPARNGTCVAMINGAINSWVLGAAQELKQDRRINVVSPGLVVDSYERYGAFFPGYDLVPMGKGEGGDSNRLCNMLVIKLLTRLKRLTPRIGCFPKCDAIYARKFRKYKSKWNTFFA
jgi:hypothetical protein